MQGKESVKDPRVLGREREETPKGEESRSFAANSKGWYGSQDMMDR